MKKLLLLIATLTIMAFGAPQYAKAGPVTFIFNSPTGPLGKSQPYTSGGVTITAYGFSAPSVAANLFGKNDGGDEIGIGISGAPHNEIQTSNFVQLDLSTWALDRTAFQMQIGSVQTGDDSGSEDGEGNSESFNIYGSNTLGAVGTPLLTGGTTEAYFSLNPLNFRFITVQAKSGDVLLRSVKGTTTQTPNTPTPEPASMLLLGTGLVGVGAAARKRRKAIRR